MQEKPKLKVDWATHEAAKHSCVNWHYSKCLPAGKLVKIGAWENSKFIGVVIFSRGDDIWPNMAMYSPHMGILLYNAHHIF